MNIWGYAKWDETRQAAIAAGYEEAPNGEERRTGLFGQGFGGEPLIILKPGDTGEWFKPLCLWWEDSEGNRSVKDHFPDSKEMVKETKP